VKGHEGCTKIERGWQKASGDLKSVKLLPTFCIYSLWKEFTTVSIFWQKMAIFCPDMINFSIPSTKSTLVQPLYDKEGLLSDV